MKGDNKYMNKFLQKVAKIFLGLSMAAGVGVAVSSGRKAERVSAEEKTISANWGNNSIPAGWAVYKSTGAAAVSGTDYEILNGSGAKGKYIKLVGGAYVSHTSPILIDNAQTVSVAIRSSSFGTINSNQNVLTVGLYTSNGTSASDTKTTATSGSNYPSDPANLVLTPTPTTGSQSVYLRVYGASNATGGTSGKAARFFDVSATYTVGSDTPTPSTYTVTINVNNNSYGTVDKASVANVTSGTSISASGSTLSVGTTSVTASPKTSSDQYDYAFSNWSGIPAGGKVIGNITVTANFTATTRTYGVTNSVSNASFTGASIVTYGTAYSGTFTANSGYILPASLTSVTIKGTATNNYSYNSTTGVFSIAAQYVTGAIVITGACEETGGEPVGISYSLSHCTIPNNPSQMYPSQEIELTIVPDDHYKLPTEAQNKVSVTGASDWVYDDETGKIMIDGADGAVSVSVECIAKAQNTISMGTLTGVSADGGNPTLVEEGATVTLTFTENSGYVLPTSSGVTVTGTGSSFTWTQGTGKLQITGGTGNITVSIIGVLRDLTDGSLTLGTKKTSYTTGDDFELPSTVTANFNVAPLTVDVKNDVVVSGPVVKNSSKYIVTGSGTITLTYTYEPSGSTQSASYGITATPVEESSAEYRKVTSISAGTYLIVYEEDGYAMSTTQGSNNRDSVSVTISNSKITSVPATAQVLTVSQATISGKTGWQFYTGSGYLYAASSSSNYLRTQTTNNANGLFTANFSGGDVTLTAQGSNTRNIIRFNTASDQLKFSCYASTSGLPVIQLYKYYPAVEPELKWITATVKSGTYYKGNSVTASDFNVTGHYNDGTTKAITSGITVTGGYLANVGSNNVTVSASGFSFTAVVNAVQAPVSSLQLDVTSASIGLDESYYLSDIKVTINPSIAIQDYTWSLFNDGGLEEGVDYTFDGDEYYSINPGTVVFRCTSDANASKYADFTLTISGVPTITITESSFDGYVGKGDTIHFVYGNISDDDLGKINFVSSNPSVVDFADGIDAGEGTGIIEIEYLGAGNATISVNYNNGETLDTVPVSVENDSVKTVTWSASNIDVWSGTTLSTTGWNVQYEMDSGDHGAASSYVIKLVGQETTEIITAGYEFKGTDNGKTIHVEYGGVSSSSITVTVTQRINNVYAESFSSSSSDLTFTEACGGSGTADDTKAWTVTSDGTESSFDSQNGKGIHYGTGSAAVQYIKLTSTAFTSGKITKVEVNASTASGVSATVSVTVGGEAFGGDPQELTSSAVPNNPYTFIGNVDADTIEVLITKPESATKALYCKSIVVTYETSSGQQQIANSASHKAAQRAAVAFAQAFNAAMDETENCTTGLDKAWATCSSAYTSFKNAAAALGSTEEAYALNLVKYATAQYSDDSGEACLERMMKTYEICVQKHGKTAFMSDLVSLGAPQVSPLVNIIGENTNTVAIIVIISMVSVTAIGGYFFLRKRKENN